MIWNTVKLNKELADAKTLVTNEGKARIQAEENLKEAQNVIETLTGEKEKLDAQVKELNEKLEAANKAHADELTKLNTENEQKVAATTASVGAAVNKELANMGVEASSIKISQETLPSKVEALEKLNELSKTHGATSKEATAYYQKVKAVIHGK